MTEPDDLEPDQFCECRPGIELREGWQHDPGCLRWSPPLRGRGSTVEHRAAALAHMRAVVAEARRRHQQQPARRPSGLPERPPAP